MTPLQFAKAQCSNFDQSTGACKGLGIKEDGSLFSFGSKPACVLVDRNPCPYFEECVLTIHFGVNAPALVWANHQAEAKHIYAQFSPNYRKTPQRKCRACNRRTVSGGKRFCPECAEKRKKASDRAGGAGRQQKHRTVTKNASPMP